MATTTTSHRAPGTCPLSLSNTSRSPWMHRPPPHSVFDRPAPSSSSSSSSQASSAARTRARTRTRAQWLENSAQVDVPTSLETAWVLWEDRERIPQWMPWITSVVIQDDDESLSKWTLSTHQFNRDWEFSWLAKNMTPLKFQKIHWRSVPGSVSGSLGGGLEIQNQGQIRFVRKNDGSCAVKLTISYEVPNALAPFANLLTPVVEGILQADMARFREYAVKAQEEKETTT